MMNDLIDMTESIYYRNDGLSDLLVPVTEKVNPKLIKEGDTYVAGLRYANGKYEKRPVAALRYPDDKLYITEFIGVDSDKENPRSLLISKCPSRLLVEVSEENGLNKPSYLIPRLYFKPRTAAIFGRIGNLSEKEFHDAKLMVSKFEKLRFTDPWHFFGWMVANEVEDTYHPSGNNNNCILQNIQMVNKSKHANCVDIANILHHMLKTSKTEHYIVRTTFWKDISNFSGHVYCILKSDLTTAYYVFRYFPPKDNKPLYGNILGYSTNNINAIIQNEESYLRTRYEKLFKTSNLVVMTTIYNEDQLKIWDECSGKTTQKELFEKLDESTALSESYFADDFVWDIDI